MSAGAPDGGVEYRIDDLAREAGMSVRNVRVYQDRGLLPPPRRQGRAAWYSEAHLARLRLVGRLLERGYTFAQIGEMLAALEQGEDLAEALGLEQALTAPWNDEKSEHLTVAALRDMFGPGVTERAVQRAVALGFLVPEGDGFGAPSMQLLRAGADLVSVGVPVATVLDLAEGLQADLDTIAHRLFTVVLEHVLTDGTTGTSPGDAADVISMLRPHAQRVVRAGFARAMDRQVDVVLGRVAARGRRRAGGDGPRS